MYLSCGIGIYYKGITLVFLFQKNYKELIGLYNNKLYLLFYGY